MTEAELQEMKTKIDRIHRALFEVPAGSPDDEKPLIEGVRIVWRAWQRGSWLSRLLMWLVPAVAACVAFAAQVRQWLS